MVSSSDILDAGSILGPWQIERRLALSPRGDVFRVRPQGGGEPAILRLASPGRSDNEDFRRRFFRECELISKVDLPEIAKILGWGDHTGRAWCVNELFANGSLADRLAENWHATGAEVVKIGIQVARGLTAAHFAGVIHRGLQPSDILLSPGRAAVGGFALTSDLSGREALSEVREPPVFSMCSAPERLRTKQTDQRSDLYSLGCVLYWAMARQPPFTGTPEEVAKQHLNEVPNPLRMTSHQCPPGLDEVVNCLLRKDPQYRYPNAMTLLEDLERVARGGTPNQARQIKSAETSRIVSAAQYALPPRHQPELDPRSANRRLLVVAIISLTAILVVAGTVALLRQLPVSEAYQPAQLVPLSSAPTVIPTPQPALPSTSNNSLILKVSYPDHINPVEPSLQVMAAAKAKAENERRRSLNDKVAAVVRTGAHLGPVADLTAQLGPPDLVEDLGTKLWYGDYVFTVADGLVLAVNRLPSQP